MIDTLLSYAAPHLCCGCGKIGTLLCDNCKYDIKTDNDLLCLACGLAESGAGICQGCDAPYSRAWCVGQRSGVLQRLIGDFKFQNMYAAHQPLGSLLVESIDELPKNTVVVPIPTVASHIRERGYDHTLLLARHITKQRQLQLSRVLVRASSTKQREANRTQRIEQAKRAFKLVGVIHEDVPYLLVDDIVTTSATVRSAAELLRSAGVREVWVAVIARQPLD